MKIFISGGTGFVGTTLVRYLLDLGHSVIATGSSSTHDSIDHENFLFISADTTEKGSWQDSLNNIDVLINLAGRTIFNRWSDRYKKEIYNSRILTTRNLVEAIPDSKEVVLCSTSAVGYYGDRGEEILKEDAVPGNDFLATVSMDWEKAAFLAEEKGARVAILRFGVVLGKNGGALAKMIPAFKSFAGGPVGSGDQWFPWIHMDDLISAMMFIIENQAMKGPVNFCAPNPVRNRDFAKALGKVLGRPSFMKTPSFMIRALMGEMGTALLGSQRTVPDKLLKNGFEFQYPDIGKALRNLVK
ncbi:MAG: TIGR01777 family oxidoreductase [Desulfobacterales bacterium]